MRRMTVLVAMIAAASLSLAAQGAKIDVTGKWAFTVQTDAGTGTPTVTLKQDGEKLSGHYSSEQLGEAELAGTVKGTEMKFTFGTELQGVQFSVVYTGTIENKDSLKGTMKIGDVANGTFTAKDAKGGSTSIKTNAMGNFSVYLDPGKFTITYSGDATLTGTIESFPQPRQQDVHLKKADGK